jgi:hypothetical protein
MGKKKSKRKKGKKAPPAAVVNAATTSVGAKGSDDGGEGKDGSSHGDGGGTEGCGAGGGTDGCGAGGKTNGCGAGGGPLAFVAPPGAEPDGEGGWMYICRSGCGATKSFDERPRFLTCSRCNEAMYCDPKCQKAHWPSHKLECKQAAAWRKSIRRPAEGVTYQQELVDRAERLLRESMARPRTGERAWDDTPIKHESPSTRATFIAMQSHGERRLKKIVTAAIKDGASLKDLMVWSGTLEIKFVCKPLQPTPARAAPPCRMCPKPAGEAQCGLCEASLCDSCSTNLGEPGSDAMKRIAGMRATGWCTSMGGLVHACDGCDVLVCGRCSTGQSYKDIGHSPSMWCSSCQKLVCSKCGFGDKCGGKHIICSCMVCDGAGGDMSCIECIGQEGGAVFICKLKPGDKSRFGDGTILACSGCIAAKGYETTM